jgi:hypothetical protein
MAPGSSVCGRASRGSFVPVGGEAGVGARAHHLGGDVGVVGVDGVGDFSERTHEERGVVTTKYTKDTKG